MAGRNSAVAAVIGLLLLAVLGRPAAAFKCGQPGSPCGFSIPKNVTCEKGPGWCEPGYYCGREPFGSPQCLPVPKDCGKAGNQCCPSNADMPHNEGASRVPFCRDGSTCWYDYLLQGQEPYLGVTAPQPGSTFGGCAAIPEDCGTGHGSPCCPNIYKSAFNPPLKRGRCPDDMFCNVGDPKARDFPGSNVLAQPPGVCYKQKPDCGVFGKTCCVKQGWTNTSFQCNPPAGSKEGPTRGYCESAPADSEDAGYYLCKPCPASLPEGLNSNQTRLIKNGCGLA